MAADARQHQTTLPCGCCIPAAGVQNPDLIVSKARIERSWWPWKSSKDDANKKAKEETTPMQKTCCGWLQAPPFIALELPGTVLNDVFPYVAFLFASPSSLCCRHALPDCCDVRVCWASYPHVVLHFDILGTLFGQAHRLPTAAFRAPHPQRTQRPPLPPLSPPLPVWPPALPQVSNQVAELA